MIGQVFELARDMGPVFYMMCAACAAHALLCGVMIALAAVQRRAPLCIYFLMPCAVFLFGMMGVTLARQDVQEAVMFASVDTIDKLVLLGLSLAYAPEFAAGVLATILFVMATCSVGIGNVLGAAPQRRWVPVRGGVVAALWAVVMALAVVLPGALFGMDRSMFLVVCAALCGVGAVLGSAVESADDEGTRRVARGRFALAVLPACALLGVGVAEQGRLMQSYGRQALDAGIWLDLLDHVSGQSLQAILDQAWHWPVTTAWIAGGVLVCMMALAVIGGRGATRSIGSVLDASLSALLMMACAATFIVISVRGVPAEDVLDRRQVVEVVAEFGPGLQVSGAPASLASPDPSSCVLVKQGGWMLLEMTPHESSRGCQRSTALADEGGSDALIEVVTDRFTQDTPCVQELGVVNAALCPDVRPLVVLSPDMHASLWSRKMWHPGRVIDMDVLARRGDVEADSYCADVPDDLENLSSYLYWATCFKTQALSWRRFEGEPGMVSAGLQEPERDVRSERTRALFGQGEGVAVVELTESTVELVSEVDVWRAGDERAMSEAIGSMRQRAGAADEVLIVVDAKVTMQRVLEVCIEIKRAIAQVDGEPIQCRLTELSQEEWRVRQERSPQP